MIIQQSTVAKTPPIKEKSISKFQTFQNFERSNFPILQIAEFDFQTFKVPNFKLPNFSQSSNFEGFKLSNFQSLK